MPSTGASKAAADSNEKSPASDVGKSVNSNDKKMMMELAQANIAEIETAKLAQRQTKNPDVLAFAKKMIEDHTQASNELAQLAQSKGVSLPDKPDSKHQAMAKKLSQLNGAKFDKQYMANAGVNDHRSALTLLKRIQTSASDPELKALAGKLQPTVELHLTMVQPKM
jgi:putative membrane protein